MLELHYLKLRGRDTLPPPSFFEENEVHAVELPAAWDKPINRSGVYLRRVLLKARECNLIFDHSFRPESDDVTYVSRQPPPAHVEAQKLRAENQR